jgi:hypothetical protein
LKLEIESKQTLKMSSTLAMAEEMGGTIEDLFTAS